MAFLKKAVCFGVVSMISSYGLAQIDTKEREQLTEEEVKESLKIDCIKKKDIFVQGLKEVSTPVFEAHESFLKKTKSDKAELDRVEIKKSLDSLDEFKKRNSDFTTEEVYKRKSAEIQRKRQELNSASRPKSDPAPQQDDMQTQTIENVFGIFMDVKKAKEDTTKRNEQINNRVKVLKEVAGSQESKDSDDAEIRKINEEIKIFEQNEVIYKALVSDYEKAVKNSISNKFKHNGDYTYESDIPGKSLKYSFDISKLDSKNRLDVDVINTKSSAVPAIFNGKKSLDYDVQSNTYQMSQSLNLGSVFSTYLHNNGFIKKIYDLKNEKVIGNHKIEGELITTFKPDDANAKPIHQFKIKVTKEFAKELMYSETLSEAELFKILHPACKDFEYNTSQPPAESKSRNGSNSNRQ